MSKQDRTALVDLLVAAQKESLLQKRKPKWKRDYKKKDSLIAQAIRLFRTNLWINEDEQEKGFLLITGPGSSKKPGKTVTLHFPIARAREMELVEVIGEYNPKELRLP